MKNKKDWFYNFDGIGKIENIGSQKIGNEIILEEPPKYPYLLINMKGGISYFRVEGKNDFTRIGGSILGESAVLNVAEIL